jgi:hypothetical protein
MIDLKEKYEKRCKVKKCQSEGGCYEIQGKRGYIRPRGDELELYLTSKVLANKLERNSSIFKVKNHYDDATSFTFNIDGVPAACKLIKAKNRRQMTPEQLTAMKARGIALSQHRLKGGLSDQTPQVT